MRKTSPRRTPFRHDGLPHLEVPTRCPADHLTFNVGKALQDIPYDVMDGHAAPWPWPLCCRELAVDRRQRIFHSSVTGRRMPAVGVALSCRRVASPLRLPPVPASPEWSPCAGRSCVERRRPPPKPVPVSRSQAQEWPSPCRDYTTQAGLARAVPHLRPPGLRPSSSLPFVRTAPLRVTP